MELDGTKRGPVDHGPCGEGGVLAASVAAVRGRGFMGAAPGNIEFSLMALARDNEGESQGN